MTNFAIVGGAGFIGSHFTGELLRQDHNVLVIDNFCNGTKEHLARYSTNPNLRICEINVENTFAIAESFEGIETVIHLASNPDIAKAALEPRIDFIQGTVLT